MNNPKSSIFSLFILIGIIGVVFQPYFSTADYTDTYYLETGGSKYVLTLTVTESLYNAYKTRSHPSTADRFVTPQVFEQVASQIRSIFVDDEDFTNAVLMIVHQIPQPEGNVPLKYPIETIVDNFGDCDVFSVLAASLMKAEGLDVVLLEYPGHMNLGVHLQYEPSSSRTGTTAWYSYNGKRYYVAETTGGLQVAGVLTPWRVGEDPGEYNEATVTSLVNCDTNSLGQVTATLTLAETPRPPIEYWLLPLAGGAAIALLFFLRTRVTRKRRETTEVKPLEDTKLPENVWCVCPKCGAHISANIEYCSCGTKLPERRQESRLIQKVKESPSGKEQAGTHVTEKVPDDVWCVCPRCGAYISANIEYCSCGTKLPNRPKKRG